MKMNIITKIIATCIVCTHPVFSADNQQEHQPSRIQQKSDNIRYFQGIYHIAVEDLEDRLDVVVIHAVPSPLTSGAAKSASFHVATLSGGTHDSTVSTSSYAGLVLMENMLLRKELAAVEKDLAQVAIVTFVFDTQGNVIGLLHDGLFYRKQSLDMSRLDETEKKQPRWSAPERKK